jgi:hypothetical protein
MTPDLNTVLITGIGAIMVLTKTIQFLVMRKKNGRPDETHEQILSLLVWIKEIHDKTDDDGTPRWYVPKQLKQLANDNSSKLIIMEKYLADMCGDMKESLVILRKIEGNTAKG